MMYRVAGLRVEAGKHNVTVLHVKGYHRPMNEEPLPAEESTITGRNEDDQSRELSNTEKTEAKNTVLEDSQSKRVRNSPAWHSSYQI